MSEKSKLVFQGMDITRAKNAKPAGEERPPSIVKLERPFMVVTSPRKKSAGRGRERSNDPETRLHKDEFLAKR